MFKFLRLESNLRKRSAAEARIERSATSEEDRLIRDMSLRGMSLTEIAWELSYADIGAVAAALERTEKKK